MRRDFCNCMLCYISVMFPHCRMNLFLGVFKPKKNGVPIWDKDFTTDRYLHFKEVCNPKFSQL